MPKVMKNTRPDILPVRVPKSIQQSIPIQRIYADGTFFCGWPQCRVKPLKIQKDLFCREENELSRAEFLRLVQAARQQGRQRLLLVLQTLCATEFTVAMLAKKGWSNEQIAAHLQVSVNNVKAMLKRTYKKLGIKDRKDLKNHMLK